MALGVGSVVTLQLASADLPENVAEGPDVNPQPPVFGIVSADAGGGLIWDILWDNGNVSAGVDPSAIEDLEEVTVLERARLWGRVVRINTESEDYQAVVVAMYRRARGREPLPDGFPQKALLCELDTGVYREVVTSALVAVPGR